MSAYEYVRTVWPAQGRAYSLLLLEAGWASVFILFCLAGGAANWPGITFFLAYLSALTAVVLLSLIVVLRESDRTETKIKPRAVNALDYLVGSGSVPFATSALGALGGAALVGPLRAGATLLSPINLASNAIKPIFIRRIAHNVAQSPKLSFLASMAIAAALLPAAVIVQFLPFAWGEQLFGETWQTASTVVLPLAFEAILGVFTSIAFAAHRAHRAGLRTLLTRAALGSLRVGAVCWAGLTYGLTGAAWALPCVTLVGVFVWWTSYVKLARRKT
ncbi:hypothetical protein IEQ44_09115 [Nocardioides sp. Y6]|uniref:Uncharacterized protein n=1 Tax=Nocardioides malaquae TaxID=2773426 RepID=A0ABR9RTF7_9ACTN|nr:hypothetical protein [Nocardioides malaquae]MBE7324813.1 hypothetical protein [Nocardioides malaquae]